MPRLLSVVACSHRCQLFLQAGSYRSRFLLPSFAFSALRLLWPVQVQAWWHEACAWRGREEDWRACLKGHFPSSRYKRGQRRQWYAMCMVCRRRWWQALGRSRQCGGGGERCAKGRTSPTEGMSCPHRPWPGCIAATLILNAQNNNKQAERGGGMQENR